MPNEKTSFFVDTNLLVYVADPANPEKRVRVRDFLTRIISSHILVLSPQSLNECYRAVTERLDLMPRNDARRFVAAWLPYCTARYDFNVTQGAWRIQDRFRFSWWDSMLLASASLAGCNVFLSEDMQHEQKIEDMIILSPFELDQNFDFAK